MLDSAVLFYGGGDRDVLERMAKTLIHRGPDEQGFFCNAKIATLQAL